MDLEDLPEDVKVCNCASCGCLLLGKNMAAWRCRQKKEVQEELPLVVYGHILGRPYCGPCLRAKPRPTTGGYEGSKDDDPGQQNALRTWEDG